MKALRILAIASLLFCAVANAQDYPPPRLKNEGTGAGAYYSLNCIGPAINCTQSAGQASLTVDVEAADISNLTASDTQVLFKDGAGISGDADMTWNKTTNTLDTGTGFIETGYLGLAGSVASTAAAINIGTITSADMISPVLANITYTGTSVVVAALQSEMNHTGSASSPTVWGVKAAARAGSSNSGINTYIGIQTNAEYANSTQTCGAFEYCVFEGIQAAVLGEDGGTHDAASVNIAIGIYVPNFPTPSGGTFIRHGLLMGEPLSMTAGAKVGFNADIFTNANTVWYYDSGTSELRAEVGGTEIMALKSTALGFFNTNPVSRPSAYTQTYSTASRTHPAVTFSGTTSNDYAPLGGGSGFQDDTEMVSFLKEVDEIKADMESTKKVLNQLIDDLQGYGLLQ